MQFFRHFSDFFQFWTFLKSEKKRVNGPKKTSISTFFHVFQKMKAYVVRHFYFLKTLVFLKSILDRFVSAGRCSRDVLTFSISESIQVTIPLVFFDPIFDPPYLCSDRNNCYFVSHEYALHFLIFLENQ